MMIFEGTWVGSLDFENRGAQPPQIPPRADDISIRIPGPAFELPKIPLPIDE